MSEEIEDQFVDEEGLVVDAIEAISEDESNSTEDNSENEQTYDLDEIADVAIDVLQMILKPFNIGDVTIDEYDGDEGELILDINCDDSAILIGRHGKTLDAIHFITSIIVRKKLGYRFPVIVDVEGYKNRQREKIESIAISAANRAISQNKEVALRPMTPYERRIVHIVLKGIDGVYTESKDEGSSRRVVIFPEES